MDTRWATVKLTLVLLYFGILPFDLDAPVLFALALLGMAIVIAGPVVLRSVRALAAITVTPVPVPFAGTASPDQRPLPRPQAPGTSGTVRSRAPARLFALHGPVAPA